MIPYNVRNSYIIQIKEEKIYKVKDSKKQKESQKVNNQAKKTKHRTQKRVINQTKQQT